jgi:hypothetical protein
MQLHHRRELILVDGVGWRCAYCVEKLNAKRA